MADHNKQSIEVIIGNFWDDLGNIAKRIETQDGKSLVVMEKRSNLTQEASA